MSMLTRKVVGRARRVGRAVAGAVCISVLLSLFCDSAFALGVDRTIAQFHHTVWTAKDGAPSQIVALAQTRDGHLWIGTARGLFRFDGVRFERYAPSAGDTLPSHNVHALMATADGGLWLSTRSGLAFLKDGRMRAFTSPDDVPRAWVAAFAADHDGRVWAATLQGLALRSGSRWLEIGADWNVGRGRVGSLLVDRVGTLWASIESKLWSLRRGSQRFEDSGIEATVGVRGLSESSDGAIWLAERFRSVRPLRDGKHQLLSANAGLALDTENMLFDRDGTLWAAGEAYGLVRVRSPEKAGERLVPIDDPLIDRYGEQDGLSGRPFALLEDAEGTIWVGTNRGLDRFRYSHVVPVSLPADLGELTLLAGHNGDVWVGSTSGNVQLHVHHDRVTARPAPSACSALKEPNGDIWWGGHGVIWRQRDERIDSFPLPADAYRADWVLELIRRGDAALSMRVLGTPGLVRLKDGLWSRHPAAPGRSALGPSATYHDSKGRLWFGYSKGHVELFDGDRVTAYDLNNGLDIGAIKVIRAGRPEYWLGGESGLAVFHDGRFRRVLTTTGDSFATVSGIIVTTDGTVWLNELRGIVRIPPNEVRSIVANPSHRATYQLLDYLDGMPGAPQMNFTVSTAVQTTDGRLWFATDHGLARIDPTAFRTNKVPPPVSILEPAMNARFPTGTERIHIRYTALSLSIPERLAFRYKLEGVDERWQEVGTRREASYTNLRPGKYTFSVMAANHDGVWSEGGTELAFEIPPAFFQTWWFMVLSIAFVASLIWAAYVFRVRQMALRMQRLHDERLDERTRIARELHDTLLQGVLSASMHLHLAADQIPDDSPAKQIVTNVIKLVSDVTEEGRQAVRGLRVSEREESLEQAFGRAKRELAGRHDIEFRVVIQGVPRALRPSTRDEVYRIGREVLVNAFRHSEARNIEVELGYLDEGLRLYVRDDGRGIDPRALETRHDDHWGLAGVKERAQKILGQLTLSTRAGAGTEIELSVPARVAYRDVPPKRLLHSLMRLFKRKSGGDQTEVRRSISEG